MWKIDYVNKPTIRTPLPGDKIAAIFLILNPNPPPLNPAGNNKPQMSVLFFASIIDAQHVEVNFPNGSSDWAFGGIIAYRLLTETPLERELIKRCLCANFFYFAYSSENR